MKLNPIGLTLCVASSLLLLTACDSKSDKEQHTASAAVATQPLAEVLPYLDIKEQALTQGLPSCQKKYCVDFEIQTLHSQDSWLNDWIAEQQAAVVMQQVGLEKQQVNLPQALEAYAKKSQEWQQEFDQNQPYRLKMNSKIAAQRNQYVLLQLSVDSQQGDTSVTQRQYFHVADRKLKHSVALAEIVQEKQVAQLDAWVQAAYKDWLKKQSKVVRIGSAQRLDWQKADWFFDQEGIGLHYRINQIALDAAVLDIYLTHAQTQQLLKADVFQAMF